jgi:hypothetical protein
MPFVTAAYPPGQIFEYVDVGTPVSKYPDGDSVTPDVTAVKTPVHDVGE